MSKYTKVHSISDTHHVYNNSSNTSIMNKLMWLLSLPILPENFTPSDKIHFVTSRDSKYQEVSMLMSGLNIVMSPLDLSTIEKSQDLTEVAIHRVIEAFKVLKAPCFLEEVSMELDIPEYKSVFPGRYFKEIAEDMIGRQEFSKMYNGKSCKLTSIFAYTSDGNTIHIFNGNANGVIHHPTQWIEGDGWDPIVILNGYDRPISQLTRWKHIIHLRQMPCAEMLSVLLEKDYSGVYEVHITIYNASHCVSEDDNPLIPDVEYINKFKTLCGDMGVKSLVIEMDNPNKPVQLQTAAYHCYKSYANAQKSAYELASEFIKAGMPVRRVRLEAMLGNEDAPKTDGEAQACNNTNYFEFHARMLVNDFDKQKSQLKEFIDKHQSDNIKLSMSSTPERKLFINSKMYGIGSISARDKWETIIQQLQSQYGFVVIKHIKPEYCVHDELLNADDYVKL